MARFGRVLSAMVTPFDANGALDLDVAARLAQHLQNQGNDGLVIAGTTGESPVLTDDERLSLFAAVVEAVNIPVIAGTGTNDTAHSVHLTTQAAALGVAGILAVCPYYNRPSQAGIEAHVRAMAAASDLPVMVYDIPVRSGRKIATATLLRLANEVPTVVALKDAAGNPAETAALISSAPDGFEVYSGDDVFTLPLLACGIVGTVGVATHWTGPDHQEMFDLWGKGRYPGCPPGEQPDARELCLRNRRRRAQPHTHQGGHASPRSCGGPGQAAHGRRARIRRATSAPSAGESATLA